MATRPRRRKRGLIAAISHSSPCPLRISWRATKDHPDRELLAVGRRSSPTDPTWRDSGRHPCVHVCPSGSGRSQETREPPWTCTPLRRAQTLRWETTNRSRQRVGRPGVTPRADHLSGRSRPRDRFLPVPGHPEVNEWSTGTVTGWPLAGWDHRSPRTIAMRRSRMAAPSARRPLCWYSLVTHTRRPGMARTVASECVRSTYMSS